MKISRISFHVLLALIWCMMHSSIHPVTFIVGYLLAWASTSMFKVLTRYKPYRMNVWEGIKLFFVFIKEMILANIQIAYIIISPSMNIRPGLIEYPLDIRNDGAIVLLANMISLTPGTLSVDISPDRKFIYVHAMVMETPDQLKQQIKNTFERRIQKMLGDYAGELSS
jgi:multicomponent Na+:H+ antiporter subunit E